MNLLDSLERLLAGEERRPSESSGKTLARILSRATPGEVRALRRRRFAESFGPPVRPFLGWKR